MRIVGIFTLFLLSSAAGLTQNKKNLDISSYIEKHQNQFGFKLALTNSTYFFGINTNGRNVIIKPNSDFKTKLLLNYRF